MKRNFLLVGLAFLAITMTMPACDDGSDSNGTGAADDDQSGDEDSGATEIPCEYRSPEECKSYNWVPFCPDRECLDEGWNHTCSEEGKCVYHEDIDFGDVQEDTNGAEWVGIWGIVFTTAVRNSPLPLVGYQDTVSVHHGLLRISQDGDKIVLHSKLCYLEIYNFNCDTDKWGNEGELSYMSVPKAYMDNVAIMEHVLDNPPPLEKGSTFETSRFWESRGCKLGDIVNDDLATRVDFLNGDPRIWDQDKDGKPAMTSLMVGVLNGEVYSDLRWSCVMVGEVVDENHLKGLMDTNSEQNQIETSNNQVLLQEEMKSVTHKDEDRCYFRMKRLDDDFATCEDVMRNARTEGDWISFTPHLDGIPNP